MADYLIAYDVSDDQRARKLRETIERLAATPIQESVWYLRCYEDGPRSLEFLLGAGLALREDRLLIAPVSPTTTWTGFNDMSGIL